MFYFFYSAYCQYCFSILVVKMKNLTVVLKALSSVHGRPRSIYIAPNGNLKYNYVTKEDLKKYTYDDKTNTYHYSSDGYGWTYDPNYNAHWAFDETTNSISMYRDDGYYAFTYKVTMNDDHNSWVGVDSKGATYTFTRVEE